MTREFCVGTKWGAGPKKIKMLKKKKEVFSPAQRKKRPLRKTEREREWINPQYGINFNEIREFWCLLYVYKKMLARARVNYIYDVTRCLVVTKIYTHRIMLVVPNYYAAPLSQDALQVFLCLSIRHIRESMRAWKIGDYERNRR